MRPKHNEWRQFGRSILDRLVKPWDQPKYVLYFLGIVLIIGGIGVWLPAMRSSASGKFVDVPEALVTYAAAIVGSSMADLLLRRRTDEESFGNFFMLLVVLISICIVLTACVYILKFKMLAGILLGIVALIIWSLSNSNNEAFKDPLAIQTIGGNGSSDETSDIAGSLKDLKI
jgi:hypothetical protein